MLSNYKIVLSNWWALNYRKNSIIGCSVISRTCEIRIQCRQLHKKLKHHRKNYQITTNNKHFTVANVHPPFPQTICTYGGSEELQNMTLFF